MNREIKERKNLIISTRGIRGIRGIKGTRGIRGIRNTPLSIDSWGLAESYKAEVIRIKL
jgi:hypothetical protein